MGYYKRIPLYRGRNRFLKRLGLRFAYKKPSNTTFLICLLFLLAGVVMAISVVNMLCRACKRSESVRPVLV